MSNSNKYAAFNLLAKCSSSLSNRDKPIISPALLPKLHEEGILAERSAGQMRPPHWMGGWGQSGREPCTEWWVVSHRWVLGWGPLDRQEGTGQSPVLADLGHWGQTEMQGNTPSPNPSCAATGKQRRSYTNPHLLVLSVIDETRNKTTKTPRV